MDRTRLIIVGMVCVFILILVGIISSGSPKELPNDRYVTSGVVILPNGSELDLDYLNDNRKESVQIYYDKVTGEITFVYSAAFMIEESK